MTANIAPGRQGGLKPSLTPGAVPPPVRVRWRDTPFMRIVVDFLRRPTAVIGLIMLTIIILAAVFAPLITPQNPYDLTEIRIEHSRLAPGAAGRAPPSRQELAIPVDPAAGSGETALELVGDAPFTEVTAQWEFVAEDRLAVTLQVAPEVALETLADNMRLDGFPRGAEPTVGEKHQFRNFWLIDADDLLAFEIVAADTFDAAFDLSIRAEQSEGLIETTYTLGTDGQGRDMLSAIIYGLRISLMVGVFSGVIAMTIGLAVGITAAYMGGRVDTITMRIVDLQLSFPAILVALMLLAILGRGADKVIMALVLAQWAYYARTARSAALVERSKEYIEAARCLAISGSRIVFRHLLPNCLPPLIVVATVQVANAIALEATLSFLGIGMPLTEPSLGLLISNGFDYLLSGRYWISVFPGVALVITIVAINLVGDRLRDVLNPRLRHHG